MTLPNHADGHDTVPVLVQTLPIEDGETPPPRVGGIGTFWLHFQEGDTDPTDPSVVTVLASAEALGQGAPSLRTGWSNADGSGAEYWEWKLFLRGDGWSATWYTARPQVGRVRLTGRLVGSMGYDTEGTIRGRINRVRVCTENYRQGVDAPVPGSAQYADVETSPRVFDRPGPTSTGEISRAVGVLVDLDLLAVPPLPLRPPFYAGAVSASSTGVWVLDRELPILVQLTGAHSEPHVFPGRIFPQPNAQPRHVHADDSGCWVAGWDGVFRCAAGTAAVQIDARPVNASAAHSGMLFTATDVAGTAMFHLRRPSGDSVSVPAPSGRIDSVNATETGFWTLITIWDSIIGGGSSRLLHVDRAGEITSNISGHRTSGSPFLVGDPPRLIDSTAVYKLRDGRDLVHTSTLPASPLQCGAVGGRIWIVTHPPDGTGARGWWPLEGPSDVPPSPQSWLLTLLDARTLEPLLSVPIYDPHPDVTQDATGVVWVVAHGLRVLNKTTMSAPIVVNTLTS